MASVIVNIPNTNWTVNSSLVAWSGLHLSLGSSLSKSGREIFLGRLQLRRIGEANSYGINLATSLLSSDTLSGPDFSDQMENSGMITTVASDGETLVVTGIIDSTEPYTWEPANATAVLAFANHLAGLADRSLVVTFDDGAAVNRAPVITAIAADPTTVDSGGVVTLTATVTDPDIT